MNELAEIGVIGGSGFYEFMDSAEDVTVETPFGRPSDPLVIGEFAGKRIAFLPRHGRDHRFPPHRIPYQANMWALRSVGVRQILAPSAVGSLTAAYGPGTLVVPAESQSNRAQDTGLPETIVTKQHVPAAIEWKAKIHKWPNVLQRHLIEDFWPQRRMYALTLLCQ